MYLRYGGVVNNLIKKGLLLSLWVKNLKSMIIWQRYKEVLKNEGIFQWKNFNTGLVELRSWVCGPTFLAHPVCLIAG